MTSPKRNFGRPRVVIDASVVIGSRVKGVGRYLRNLIAALGNQTSAFEYVLLLTADRWRTVPRWIKGAVPDGWRVVLIPAVSSLFVERLILPVLCRRLGANGIYSVRERLPCLGKTKLVLCLFEVPDYRMNAAALSGGRKEWATQAYSRFAFRGELNRAALICVSSSRTKDDLVQLYHVSPEKIRLVYPGISSHFSADAMADDDSIHRQRLGLPRHYVLHFATGDFRDNTDVAIRAFARARHCLPRDMRLVLAGVPKELRGQLVRLLDEHGLTDAATVIGYIPDESMPALYRLAIAYLDPTLYEGFGFQVVEAMKSGVPVISSDRSSIPELARDCACLVDPHRPEDVAAALLQVVNDDELRTRLRTEGIRRAAHFRWEVAAALTNEALTEVL